MSKRSRRQAQLPTRAEKQATAEATHAKFLAKMGLDPKPKRVRRSSLRGVIVQDHTGRRQPVLADTGNVIAVSGNVTPKRSRESAVPEGFFIGHSHKQGLTLIPRREAEWGGGKKT